MLLGEKKRVRMPLLRDILRQTHVQPFQSSETLLKIGGKSCIKAFPNPIARRGKNLLQWPVVSV